MLYRKPNMCSRGVGCEGVRKNSNDVVPAFLDALLDQLVGSEAEDDGAEELVLDEELLEELRDLDLATGDVVAVACADSVGDWVGDGRV